MSHSVISVVGKDRIGIVYDVSKILTENRISIINISQQLMGEFFTMIILVDTTQCPKSRQEMLDIFVQASQALALDIRNYEIGRASCRERV